MEFKAIFFLPLLILCIAVIFSFGINTVSAANSSHIYVSNNGNDTWDGLSSTYNGTSGPKATIKNAIGTVKTDGTISIAKGTYKECGININKNMVIIGETPLNTIIGSSNDTVFIVGVNVRLTLMNLSIKNNNVSNNLGTICNNGILTLNNTVFQNNTSERGGAIRSTGTLIINSSTFLNNRAQNYGGAILNIGTATITNTIFKNNNAREGGAIFSAKSLTLIHSTIENNIATNGGAIYNWNYQKITINNSTLQKNTATDSGGAIYNEKDGTIIITYTSLNNNTAAQGGAIYNNGTLTLNNSYLQNNTGISSGGAIFNYFGTSTLIKSTLENNTANGFGGSIFIDNGTLILNSCIFLKNKAAEGGAFYNKRTINIKSCRLQNNTAEQGGAICNNGILTLNSSYLENNIGTINGGAVYNNGTMSFSNNTLQNNSATHGGAIYNNGTITLNSCTLLKNKASVHGGAIYNNYSKLTVNNNKIQNNSAVQGGAIYNTGNINITDTSLQSNTATNSGGALYNNCGNLTITTSRLNQNKASTGGMLYINDGVANVNFCQIVGNTFKSTEIYCQSGKTDINNNWWGSNNDPSFHVNSNINITTWMVLHIIISPNKVLYGENSTVTADILFDNLNNYLDPVNGHVPDGVMVNYSSNVGGFYQSYNYLINGIAESIFTAKTVGKGNISVIVDDQTINSPITIDPLPTVTATPKGGLYNQTQSVRLKMNKAGIIYYTLNGSLPTTSSKKYTGPISITTTAVLKYIAIDLSNNQSPVYTQKYIIDRIAPKITTTTPKNNSTGYPRTKNITINFTKNITNSINYNNITIKNLHTGKTLILTKTITKNLLTLKTSTLSSSTWYQVIIPKASIKDLAGNKLTTTYTFKFKTRG